MDPSTAALEVAKLIPVAKSAFDHLKTRMKTAEDIPKLIDLYDAFQTLRDENMRLREELRQRDARAAYTRKKMGVAVVRAQVEPDGTAGPPCCPKCNDDDGEPLPLQGRTGSLARFGSHWCTSCQGTFEIR